MKIWKGYMKYTFDINIHNMFNSTSEIKIFIELNIFFLCDVTLQKSNKAKGIRDETSEENQDDNFILEYNGMKR